MAGAEARTSTLVDVGGRQVQAGLQSALAYLQANQDNVNDLNVFPVPDGDTGSNMYLTLRSAVEDASRVEEPNSAAAVLGAAAHGSLMGARGNSGVILSQILRGFAQGLHGHQRVDGPTIAAALVEAGTVAYKAVMKPTEGTILTVIREAAGAAQKACEQDGADVFSVLDAAVEEAHASVDRTPEQLAVLRDAGVVDAGGFGLAIILEGFARALREGDAEVPERAPHRVMEPAVRRPGTPESAGGEAGRTAVIAGRRGAAAIAEHEAGWGYCTEFLINGPGLDIDRLRTELSALGESALVVGDAEMVRVHIHTDDPARLIAAAAQRGRLARLKVEDMSAQHHEVLERAAADEAGASSNGAAPEARKPLAVVTVAPGTGFRDILLGIGADRVVEGGQTMNPSTQDLLQAVLDSNADNVIILPNNKNVILTAQQVDALADGARVRVVPSKTLPQGITALLALDTEAALDDNVARMQESLAGVTTVEVTRAVRDSVVDGLEIHTGDVIALVDDRITQVGHSVDEVVEAAVAAAPAPPELITVYRGAGVDESEAEALAARLRENHPGVEVEIHSGGQEHYPFILSLE